MKKFIIILSVSGLAGYLAYAFGMGPIGPSFDPNAKPYSLPEVYGVATHTLGAYTNDFQCVEAKRDADFHAWLFSFSGTNALYTHITMWVADRKQTGEWTGEQK